MSDDFLSGARTGLGECSGSFGEILQGVLPGPKKFLINCKIKHKSRVRLTLTDCQYSPEKERLYAESYVRFSKSYKGVRNIMADIGNHSDLLLTIESDIPMSKGLSSSTADMVASIQALEAALSLSLKKEYVGRMITEIEPNDGLHYDGTAGYHHTTGQIIFQTDFVPPLHILGIDNGGLLDTVQFNRRQVAWTDDACRHYAGMLERAQAAYDRRDVAAICAIATESAKLWQTQVFKPALEAVIAFGERTGALGVINAHSGTYLGLLYESGRSDIPDLAEQARRTFLEYAVDRFETITCR